MKDELFRPYASMTVLTESANDTHPGFVITCQKCGSTDVYVENSLGFSSESGQWGSVDLVCANCNESVAIYGD